MTGPAAVRIAHPDVPAAVVLSVPHGGTFLPAAFASALRVPPETLWSDWYTRELYDLAPELPIPTLSTDFSRFVADPNRAPVSPQHGDFWSTVVPARDPGGVPLYDRPLTSEQLRVRLALAHVGYHKALDHLVAAALRRRPRVLLLDLHSFGLPLGVDIVVGDGHGTTAGAAASDRVEHAFRSAGFTVARNLRFTGGHIVRRWAGDERVDAVQIELDQRRYLLGRDVAANRPRPRRDPALWAETRRAITRAVGSLATECDG